VWKNEKRHERQIGVGMIGRTLRSSRRTKSAVKGELVQNGVPMKTKHGVHDGERQRLIRKPCLNILDKKDEADVTKRCILRHAKHCCRRSSQVQAFFPQGEGDVDRDEALLGVDIEKR